MMAPRSAAVTTTTAAPSSSFKCAKVRASMKRSTTAGSMLLFVGMILLAPAIFSELATPAGISVLRASAGNKKLGKVLVTMFPPRRSEDGGRRMQAGAQTAGDEQETASTAAKTTDVGNTIAGMAHEDVSHEAQAGSAEETVARRMLMAALPLQTSGD